jgi:protein-S-isoprenylcysteine O-methyltransferase Ste14
MLNQAQVPGWAASYRFRPVNGSSAGSRELVSQKSPTLDKLAAADKNAPQLSAVLNLQHSLDSLMKPETSVRLRYLGALSPLFYLGIALLCLRQRTPSQPWSRIDVYSGGFFLLNTLAVVYEFTFNRSILHRVDVLREASGSNYDSSTVKFGLVQTLLDLCVFLFYGHARTISVLANPLLRGIGLGCYGTGVLCLLWTDTVLMRHFEGGSLNRELMTTGPYGIVRHPRYASLLLAKIGFAFIFANFFGWASAAFSFYLAQRRISLEEVHLQGLFAEKYGIYSRQKSRLLPYVY